MNGGLGGDTGPLPKVLDRVLLKAVPAAAAWIIKTWCMTCRVTARINEHAERSAVETFGGAVYATWHQRMFYFFHDFGSRHVTMMISRSRDGEYANQVALRLGFLSVRGSSKKGGRDAMRELIERLKSGGHTAGMMADGPTGPPRVLKMGTVKIARETGKPIIPMMYGARRRIVLKSWDRYFIPVPFTDVVVFHGNPVHVPADADEKACESIRQEVERTMNEMADVCDTFWGGVPVGKPGYDLPAAPGHLRG
ncbi:MAG TPA: lysophospholipid acyltransferase family protein [Deltaproteobacteria bacterium]|nr:lysophospholipid acyltransferase family protein [Deltaproteobacteria bacterium]